MKIRFWGAALVFISAYSPLSVIFFIQDVHLGDKRVYLNHPYLTFSCLVISLLSCLLLISTVKSLRSGTHPVKIIHVSRKSGELVNYSIPYMISFFVVDLGDIRILLSFAFFLVLMFWLTYRTHNIFINPILACLGYNLYDVTYEISGKRYSSFFLHRGERLQPGYTCRLSELSEQLHLVHKLNIGD